MMKVIVLVCVLVATVAAVAPSKPCLASAGYSWCQSEGKCVRPWELAKDKNIHFNSKSDFVDYCNGKNVGSDKNSHGCVASAGYSWCQKENKCVKPWELASERSLTFTTAEDFQAYCGNTTTSTVGADSDSHGCVASAGYSWCAKQSKCVKPWEITKGDQIAFQEACADCLASAGYVYCYYEQKCVRPWELAKKLSIENTPEAIQNHCQQPLPVIVPVAQVAQNNLVAQVNLGGADGPHNCLASAGYSWCQAEGKCVRPWELAKERSLGNTPDAIDNYCNSNGVVAPQASAQVFITGPLLPLDAASHELETGPLLPVDAASHELETGPLLPSPGTPQNQ